jgi:MYXO-CTERM domain-containing protein
MTEVDLPGTSSVSVPLAQPETCRNCHGLFDPLDSPYESWVGSPMAHAARNPLFLSALTEANEDKLNTGDFCLRCHAPDAWLQNKCIEPDGALLDQDDDGVSCAVCHRMDPSPWKKNGQYVVADTNEYRGPFPDATAPHRWRQGMWISSSELCGGCHDLFNPLVERRAIDGTPLGVPFPEQTTYTEWATSSVAASKGCKDCHMPETAGPVAEGAQVRSDRSRHELSGGNTFALAAIDFLEPGLGLSEQLARGRARAEAQLRNAATLELIDAPAEALRGEPVTLTFRITNRTGHKLPTGYPIGRRVWLSVTSPELALLLGRYDQSMGEPIDPAAIYHVEQGQFGIGPSPRIALNDVVFLDTRIPPAGMISTATTAPVGKTYPEVAPGILAHWDEVVVTATTPCDMAFDAVSVRASLWYQSVTRAYVDHLVETNGAGSIRGQRLRAAFDEADPGPFEMETIAQNIPIRADSSCAVPDAGFVDTGITDAGTDDAGGSSDAGPIIPEDDGCGCRATPVDGSGAQGLILLLLGLARRRRR